MTWGPTEKLLSVEIPIGVDGGTERDIHNRDLGSRSQVQKGHWWDGVVENYSIVCSLLLPCHLFPDGNRIS